MHADRDVSGQVLLRTNADKRGEPACAHGMGLSGRTGGQLPVQCDSIRVVPVDVADASTPWHVRWCAWPRKLRLFQPAFCVAPGDKKRSELIRFACLLFVMFNAGSALCDVPKHPGRIYNVSDP